MTNSSRPTGLYFEEFQLGATFNSRGRTITETDIVNFAGLSGDYNPMHTDAEYASKTMFGERVAHGMLGLSIATGLTYQLGFIEGTVIAFLEVNWKFRAPIKIGDTVHVESTISDLKDAARMGGGLVTSSMKLVNQRGEITQKGDMILLVAKKPADIASEP